MSPPINAGFQDGKKPLLDMKKSSGQSVSVLMSDRRFEHLSIKDARDNVTSRRKSDESVMFFPMGQLKFNDLSDMMTSKSKVAEVKKFKAVKNEYKSGKLVKVNRKEIAIFRYGDKVYAIDEKCPHVGGPLHLGDIETLGQSNILCIVCPWHKWKIDLETGKLKVPQKPKQTNVYPVKVSNDGSLSIGFSEFSPDYFLGEDDF